MITVGSVSRDTAAETFAFLAEPGPALTQFMRGLSTVPVPLAEDALVISDNADLYGTLADLTHRQAGQT